MTAVGRRAHGAITPIRLDTSKNGGSRGCEGTHEAVFCSGWMAHMLLVENDPDLCQLLSDALKRLVIPQIAS
jgi:hypothetical protein